MNRFRISSFLGVILAAAVPAAAAPIQWSSGSGGNEFLIDNVLPNAANSGDIGPGSALRRPTPRLLQVLAGRG